MMDRQRIVLCIRYDGSAYHGWQSQDGVTTVQTKLEIALSRVANHSVHVTCAGRTDAGVHATGQIIHFDTDAERSEYSWVFGANSNLPHDICVTWAKVVSFDFHARFAATARKYRYVIYNHTVRSAILSRAVDWYRKPLDEKIMQQAAQFLVGEHDFSAYRGAACQAQHAVRTVNYINVFRQHSLVIVEIQANAFLLHMVRNIVGVLKAVGAKDHPPEWVNEVLQSKDRRQGAVTAAAHGLYLVEVDYPDCYNLPQHPVEPFFLSEEVIEKI